MDIFSKYEDPDTAITQEDVEALMDLLRSEPKYVLILTLSLTLQYVFTISNDYSCLAIIDTLLEYIFRIGQTLKFISRTINMQM